MTLPDKKAEKADGRRAWYQAAVGAALVAGAFCAVVCAVLVAGALRGRTAQLRDAELVNELKVVLSRHPQDTELKTRIRELDLQLREAFFGRQAMLRRGAYLLLCGAGVFFIGLGSAAALRKKPPHPEPGGLAEDEAARTATMARGAVVALGIAVAIGAVALVVGTRRDFPGESAKPARYPPPEEIRKHWPRFRGPGGAGVSAYTTVPTAWNGGTGDGIVWKSAVPLPGENSPIVWGNRVFLSGATERKREVYCYDAATGRLRWQRAVETPTSAALDPPEVLEDTGFAASTTVADGRHVYAIFANGDVACFDFDGNAVWTVNLGVPENMYGHASSLAMWRDRLLVLLDQGSDDQTDSKLIALDARSGKSVWQAARPIPNSWATPIVIRAAGRDQVVTCGNPWVIAYDPASGKEIWRANCLEGDVAPSPVYADGLVFVVNISPQLSAIRADGHGDVTKSHVVWSAEDDLPDVCSPLTNGKLVWLLTSDGLLTCYRAKDGQRLYEHEYDALFLASPSLAGDRLYLLSARGVMMIVSAGETYEELGRAELGERAHASPAFLDGRIYIRGNKHLYCIGSAQE